jgi:hypothetical protein
MSPERERSIEKVFAEARQAYLKAVKEGLAEVDIEAVDMTRAAARPDLYWPPCWPGCYPGCYPGCWPSCWPHCWHPCWPCGPCDPVATETKE